MRFFGSVAECSDQNRMSAANLATCLGPCLLFTREDQQFNAYVNAAKVVEFLINEQKKLFPSEQPADVPTTPNLRLSTHQNPLDS